MHVPSVAWYNVTIPNVANAPSGFKLGGSPMTVAPLIAMKSVRKELGALAAEAQQMRTSAKQLENERSSGRPESRSKGVDR